MLRSVVIRYLMNFAKKTVRTLSVFDPTSVTITHSCPVLLLYLSLSLHVIPILILQNYQLSVSDPSQTTTAILSMSLTDMKTNLNTKKMYLLGNHQCQKEDARLGQKNGLLLGERGEGWGESPLPPLGVIGRAMIGGCKRKGPGNQWVNRVWSWRGSGSRP